jgi:hypothetical protein
MTLPVSEATILDEVIEDFIAGRADFARFREGVEHQLARHPELTEATLLWLDTLRRGGKLSPGLHALMAEVIERGSSGDVTPSFGEEDTIQQVSAAIGAARSESRAPAARSAPAVAARTEDAVPADAEPPRIEPAASGEPEPEPQPRPEPEAEAAPQSTSVGTLIAARYRLRALLARGGMSLVYRAEDMQDGEGGESVAVKVIAPAFLGRNSRRELEREGSLLAELDHPGVVRLLDYGQHGENAFLVTELLEGERLRNLLIRRRPGALPADQAIQIARDLADALAYLHRRGLVHRDVKPANIFITATGGVRLIDFGLSAPAGDSDGRTGFKRLAGLSPRAPRAFTPLYASPEMLLGAPPDPRDDVYSLGCVVYEMLTGHPPWGKLPADEAAHRKLTASRPAGLSATQWAVLRSAIAFRAADRPADAGAFLAAFFAPGRSRRAWGLAAAILGGVAFGLALLPFGPESPTDPAGNPTPDPVVILEPPANDLPAGAGPEAVDEQMAVAEPQGAEPQGAEPQAAAPQASQPDATQQQATAAPPTEDPEPAEGSAVAEAAALAGVTESPPAEAPAPATERPAAAVAQPARPEPRQAAAPRSPPALSFTADRFRVMKSGSALRLELPRPARYEGPLRVRWRTVDQTAREGRHFIGSPAWQYTEAPREAPALVIFVPIVQDSIPGPDRTFSVELDEVSGGPPLGSPTRAEVTIISDQ